MVIDLSRYVGKYVALGLHIGKRGFGRVHREGDSFFLYEAMLGDTTPDFIIYADYLFMVRELVKKEPEITTLLKSYEIAPEHVEFVEDISHRVVNLEQYVSEFARNQVKERLEK